MFLNYYTSAKNNTAFCSQSRRMWNGAKASNHFEILVRDSHDGRTRRREGRSRPTHTHINFTLHFLFSAFSHPPHSTILHSHCSLTHISLIPALHPSSSSPAINTPSNQLKTLQPSTQNTTETSNGTSKYTTKKLTRNHQPAGFYHLPTYTTQNHPSAPSHHPPPPSLPVQYHHHHHQPCYP